MVGLDLCATAKLAVIWTMLECFYVVDLILDLICNILAFYCIFCAFRIILFYNCMFLKNFIRKWINQTYTIKSLAVFQVFQLDLTTSLAQLSILSAKLWKVVTRGKVIFFFIFGHFFFKMYIFEVVRFFITQWLSSFQWQYVFIRFMFLRNNFSS